MYDTTTCPGTDCPMRANCYRYLLHQMQARGEIDKPWMSTMEPPWYARDTGVADCDYFVRNN